MNPKKNSAQTQFCENHSMIGPSEKLKCQPAIPTAAFEIDSNDAGDRGFDDDQLHRHRGSQGDYVFVMKTEIEPAHSSGSWFTKAIVAPSGKFCLCGAKHSDWNAERHKGQSSAPRQGLAKLGDD